MIILTSTVAHLEFAVAGKGKGGQSIWGGKFKDEFVEQLRHNQRGILSMAGRKGKPDTNGKCHLF
jgi:cyclophilin family peptidyl-prolyl cis-trans isomerase